MSGRRPRNIARHTTHIIVSWPNPNIMIMSTHEDFMMWKPFPYEWPFVRGICQFPLDSHHKGPVLWVMIFSLLLAWTSSWTNNQVSDDYKCRGTECDITVMSDCSWFLFIKCNLQIIESIEFMRIFMGLAELTKPIPTSFLLLWGPNRPWSLYGTMDQIFNGKALCLS